MKQSEKEQAYVISEIFAYMKNNAQDIVKDEVRYWKLQNKMIRNFEIADKNYIQLISEDEETIYVSFCEVGNLIRFYKCNVTIDYIANVFLKAKQV